MRLHRLFVEMESVYSVVLFTCMRLLVGNDLRVQSRVVGYTSKESLGV